MMKTKRKSKLSELRSGLPALNNGHPAAWLVGAVGQEVADAVVLFDAEAVEMVTEGVTLRLGGDRRALRGGDEVRRQHL